MREPWCLGEHPIDEVGGGFGHATAAARGAEAAALARKTGRGARFGSRRNAGAGSRRRGRRSEDRRVAPARRNAEWPGRARGRARGSFRVRRLHSGRGRLSVAAGFVLAARGRHGRECGRATRCHSDGALPASCRGGRRGAGSGSLGCEPEVIPVNESSLRSSRSWRSATGSPPRDRRSCTLIQRQRRRGVSVAARQGVPSGGIERH